MLSDLSFQLRLPDKVVICPASSSDVDEAGYRASSLSIEIITGPKGSCHQRNAIIEHVRDLQSGVLIFFDDDFFPMPDYLAELELLFSTCAEVVVATGDVLADGAPKSGFTVESARAILAAQDGELSKTSISDIYNGYGCNLAVRIAAINRLGVRFDERLPMYGWLEDVDFSRQLSVDGRVVKCTSLRGVHLGSKVGRTSGLRFGYSQIANPWYLARKRTLRVDIAFRQAARNFASNVTRSLRPEPWVDRRGRLRGNLIALFHLLRGRLDPGNVFRIK